ncbi:MAG: MliC family protein [Candidatus Paceibacterota bacterium]
MKKTFLSLAVLILILVALLFWKNNNQPTPKPPADTTNFIAEADYQCNGGKQIKASYFKSPAVPTNPEEPPIPTGKVELVLSDGRQLTLQQTISGSGIRYATSDESLIFWSKGENAFIVENNIETYTNCTERIWTLGNEQLDRTVRNFLLSRNELSWKTEVGSSNFCIFQNLAPERDLFPFYLWVRCGEYKMDNGQLKELSGVSVPIKIDYPNELSYYDFKKFSISIPRDGSLYDKDVKIIFPKEIWGRLHFESGPLNEKIKQEALKYFSLSKNNI